MKSNAYALSLWKQKLLSEGSNFKYILTYTSNESEHITSNKQTLEVNAGNFTQWSVKYSISSRLPSGGCSYTLHINLHFVWSNLLICFFVVVYEQSSSSSPYRFLPHFRVSICFCFQLTVEAHNNKSLMAISIK